MIETLWQDVRLSVRGLIRSRWVSVVAAGSLALGIAANTTVFSLVQAVEFPRLPYPDSQRILFVESRNDERGIAGMLVSAPDAADIASSAPTLEVSALAADQSSVLRVDGRAIRVSGRRVEPEFFDVLGLPAALGRTLGPQDRPGVILLGDGLWRSRFGSDRMIIGAPIRVDGDAVTVVGVMPPGFDPDADFWTPLAGSTAGHRRDDRQFMLFARVERTASIAAAGVELGAISRRLAAEHPATNRGWTMVPIELSRLHGRDARKPLLLLQAAVALVLLIACANIAHILLARGTRRRHEMAVRLSLGATRARLISALLMDAVVLSAAGGTLGLVLSMWGIDLARAIGGFPDVIDPRLNGLVLTFTSAVAMLTAVLCGIAPALRGSAVAPDTALRHGGRGGSGDSRGRLRAAMAAGQIAAALALSVCAVLMLQSLANRHRVDLGFEPRLAVRGEVMFAGERYSEPSAVRAAVEAILVDLASATDVTAAGASTWALPTGAGAQRQMTLPSDEDRLLPTTVRRGVEAVTPGYFDALGIPVKLGRAFTDADRRGTAAIVNDELAQHLWPGRSPVGELLRLGGAAEEAPIVTVVGVVGTVRRSPMHGTPVAIVYLPLAQYPNPGVAFTVRARHDVGQAASALEAAVARADAMLVPDNVRSIESQIAEFVAPLHLITFMLTAFGVAGVLLAALGVFGTMSYAVTERRQELAIRAALGAGSTSLLGLVLGSAVRITVIGILVGAVLAFASTRALGSYLFGVASGDPLTYTLVAVLLCGVSVGACYRPARLAASADPAALLRS